MKVLGFGVPELLILFGMLIIGLLFGWGCARIASKKGYSYGGFFALGFFLPIIGLIIALVIGDKASAPTADELLKYKTLLDQGVITQEEFELKKQQLMSH